jgi:hypothetical protein
MRVESGQGCRLDEFNGVGYVVHLYFPRRSTGSRVYLYEIISVFNTNDARI